MTRFCAQTADTITKRQMHSSRVHELDCSVTDSVEVVAELALEDSGELFEREEVRDQMWVS